MFKLNMLKLKWDKEWDRFIPWKKRRCIHCKYPLSEKMRWVETTTGIKKEYCCNICYTLREDGKF